MKFIRVHGRVVPIKDGSSGPKKQKKQQSVSKKDQTFQKKQSEDGGFKFGQQAAFGAGTAIAAGLANNAMKYGNSKTAIGFGVATAAIGLTGLNKNIKNSVSHGRNRKSFLSGVGRYITNGMAANIGALSANKIVRGLGKLAAKKGSSAAATGAKLLARKATGV